MSSSSAAYHGLPAPVVFSQDSAMQAADRRARHRIVSALIVGFGIWIITGLVTGGIVVGEVRHYSKGSSGMHRPSPPTGALECEGFTIQPDSYAASVASLHPVASYFAPTRTAETSLALPLAEKNMELFFKSTGQLSHGAVTYAVDPTLTTSIVADVTARFNDARVLNLVEVCSVKDMKAVGINLQTPDHVTPSWTNQISFEVHFRLPASLESLEALKVSSSIFSVSAPSLPPITTVDIHTSNAVIDFADLSATTIALRTSNAKVHLGKADASSWITVKTSNGAVDGNFISPSINVTGGNAPITGSFTVRRSLNLDTSNGKIDASIALVTSDEFDVRAKTSNAGVNVVYTEQPKDSHLTSVVTTSNGRAQLRHDPQYEGSFDITTSNLPTKVLGPRTVVDPSKSSRTRFIDISQAGKHSAGVVWWGKKTDEAQSRGSSTLHTSNSEATIEFL